MVMHDYRRSQRITFAQAWSVSWKFAAFVALFLSVLYMFVVEAGVPYGR